VIITMRWRRCADWSLRPEVMAINAGLLLMSSSISFEQETLVHFREEEEVVFPLVAGRPEAQDGLTRLLMEHARNPRTRRHTTLGAGQRRTVRRNDDGDGRSSASAIRFEEKTFFPLIERLIPGRLEGIYLSERHEFKEGINEHKKKWRGSTAASASS
jgi:hypothetical protein